MDQKFKKKLSLNKKKISIIDDDAAKQIRGGQFLSIFRPFCPSGDCGDTVTATWNCDPQPTEACEQTTAIVCTNSTVVDCPAQ